MADSNNYEINTYSQCIKTLHTSSIQPLCTLDILVELWITQSFSPLLALPHENDDASKSGHSDKSESEPSALDSDFVGKIDSVQIFH